MHLLSRCPEMEIKMEKHSHQFVEQYRGLVGFGYDRETNESTTIYYLQKFSDDTLLQTLIKRMSDQELDEIYTLINRALIRHLSDEEYHNLFLKDEHHK